MLSETRRAAFGGEHRMTSVGLTEDIRMQESCSDAMEESLPVAEPAEGGTPRKKAKVQRSLRDRIVLDHLPLVKAIAVRVHENLPVHVDLDDLIHAGILGLFDAASKYDPDK